MVGSNNGRSVVPMSLTTISCGLGSGKSCDASVSQSLACLLEAFLSERDGQLVCSSETPETYLPDYMVGYVRVAVCLLRLSRPADRPTQISRAALRYTPQIQQ